MNNFREKYKVRAGGNDTSTRRLLRAGQHEERRKVNRDQNFSRQRDIFERPVEQEIPSKNSPDQEAKLRKWKAERDLKRKIEQQKKKPIFKVGVVHHHFYSPTAKDRCNSKSVPCHTKGAYKVKHRQTPPKRITRATQKRLDAKKAATLQTPATSSISHTSLSHTNTQRERLSSIKKSKMTASFAPKNHTFKAPIGVKVFGRLDANRDSNLAANIPLENVKNQEEQTWPTTSAVSGLPSSPQIIQNRLVRQMAVEVFNLENVNENSSAMEDSGKTKIADDNQPCDDAVYEPTETTDVTDLNTPPRSGSPAPATFSPYVTISRSKDSARRERRSKLGLSRTPPDEIPTKETVMQNLNISVEEEERTAQYFKMILQREIDRLEAICAKWASIMNSPDLPEDAQYLINQAIGQTNLLVRKKFERFRVLVSDCETGKGQMLVQCKDLQGFWDMMYMQVIDCESRFNKLDILHSNNWIEEEIVVKKTAAKKKAAPSKRKINAKSTARSWILARKQTMSQSEERTNDVVIVVKNNEAPMPSKSGKTETPRDTMSRRSARKSPQTVPRAAKRLSLKQTPKKTPVSVLKNGQLTETMRNIHSPLAVMKISKLFKTPEVKLDDTISYINSDQTPGRGILKRSEDFSSTRTSRKVDFSNDVVLNEVPLADDVTNEDLQNSIDLGRALARIESYDSDGSDDVFEAIHDVSKNITTRGVEKSIRLELDFENESFNETKSTDTAETTTAIAATPETHVVPIVNITMPTPQKNLSPGSSNSLSASKNSRRENSIVTVSVEELMMEPNISTTRVLRNRTVAMSTTNKKNRRSRNTSPNYADIMNSSTKENEDPQMEDTKICDLETSKAVKSANYNYDDTKRRRSTRKSVRFNAEDCSGCAGSTRPTHPMTPHTRRSRKVSLLGDNSQQSNIPLINGDLMSFDSPAVVPSRVRRASERKSSQR